MKLHRDRPGDFEVLRENVASIDQHVIALFDTALIEYSGREAESRSAARGYQIVRIIGVLIRRLVGGASNFSAPSPRASSYKCYRSNRRKNLLAIANERQRAGNRRANPQGLSRGRQ